MEAPDTQIDCCRKTALKVQQATSGIKDVVKRQTEWAQQIKEKEEEKTAMLQSLLLPTNTIPFLRKSRKEERASERSGTHADSERG